MRTCPRCGHVNRQEATWCERCQKGLTLGGRMAEPWGTSGIASRITTWWALLTGAGCLLLFVFLPLGIFLLVISVWIQHAWKNVVRGVCPRCGKEILTIRRPGAPREFPCVHCEKLIGIDASSGKPVIMKASIPSVSMKGATTGTTSVETAWTPIGGEANFRTRELFQMDIDRVAFRSTARSNRFYFMFTLVFTAALIISVYKLISGEDRSPGWALLAFLTAASSGYSYYSSRIPWVFDKRNGTFSKPRFTAGIAFGARGPAPSTRLDDIHALQLISKNAGSNTNYTCYELNLVLYNGERVPLVAHGDTTRLRGDATALAAFLGKPLRERI